MIKPKLIPVIDNKNLVRDTQNKALLATNSKMLEEHRQKKAFLKKVYEQSNEIDSMKRDIQDIKYILLKLAKDV